jgi:hypothetical protein
MDVEALNAAAEPASAAAALGLQRGEEVDVRSLAEIRATLDERGTLDGMPFMPEMARFAGRRARVWRRADRVCVEGSPTQRRLPEGLPAVVERGLASPPGRPSPGSAGSAFE